MSDRKPPKIEDAPGLVWVPRQDGWAGRWQCRTDKAQAGFLPRTVPLFRGIEPSAVDRAYIQAECQKLQADMLAFGVEELVQEPITYDGTIKSLAHCFKTDPDSTFRKNRYATRQHYGRLISRIVTDHGEKRLPDLKGRDMMRWHEEWTKSGVPMAHSLIRMTRALFGFGMTLLEDPDCARLVAILSKQRYEMGKTRGERLTADQVALIRAEAHRQGFPSIALAQAIQFECIFRQKDVIGEWVPLAEPSLSEVEHEGKKWLRGIRWSEIDENLVLRHVTSKRQKMIEPDLRLMPMVIEELQKIYEFDGDRSKLKASGPMIICDRTGRPWTAHYFRQRWRKIAKAAGVPDGVWNMDSRSGGISEATDAGAQLEDVRHAATHSNIATTQRYSRGSADKAAKVQKLRVVHRKGTP